MNQTETVTVQSLSNTETFWFGHLHKHQLSGMSKVDYAKENGLTVTTFYYWSKR